MIKNWNNKETEELMEAILALDNTSEARRFFRDLLTEAEIREFANRWKAAQMLDNNIPYTTISQKTGLSSTTIARISKWLNSGMGGYKLVLEKLSLHHNNRSSG